MTASALRRLVLQSTSFCNLRCSYCYLPHRGKRRVMPLTVVDAVARRVAESGLLGAELDIRWHAGEPLAAPLSFYRRAIEVLAEVLGPLTSLRHSLQTNATLVNDRWCEFFASHGIDVGVSIDGPPSAHDAHRRDRSGRGTHDRAMRGVGILRRNEIPFDIISVVTEETLRDTARYLDFIADLAPRSLGVNPEESEGDHVSRLFGDDRFRVRYAQFLFELLAWQDRTGIPVRRLTAMRSIVLSGELPVRNDQIEPFALISVGADGSMSTYSPELLGWPAPEFDDFVFGSAFSPGAVRREWSPRFRLLAEQVERGKEMCRRGCEYFALCGGGAAANKWSENGTFASTRTKACEANVMAVADVVIAALEGAEQG